MFRYNRSQIDDSDTNETTDNLHEITEVRDLRTKEVTGNGLAIVQYSHNIADAIDTDVHDAIYVTEPRLLDLSMTCFIPTADIERSQAVQEGNMEERTQTLVQLLC